MWLPPYFGNYEDFLKALLHNPFLGSGRGPKPLAAGPSPRMMHEPDAVAWRAANPEPVPWMLTFLISAVASKEAASAMTNRQAAQQITATAETAISQFLDDYCGTPPRLIPWPFPGPPPWVSVIAAELTGVANTLPAGGLRSGLLQVAGQMLDRVALNPQPLPPKE